MGHDLLSELGPMLAYTHRYVGLTLDVCISELRGCALLRKVNQQEFKFDAGGQNRLQRRPQSLKCRSRATRVKSFKVRMGEQLQR